MVNSCVLLSNNDPLLRNGQVHVLLLDNDPLLGIGQIQILLSSRPSARQWSLFSWLHRGPLRGNGHRFLYIKTLSFGMVIDSLCHIETLSVGLVVDSFTSRPSAKQWSLISWLHRDPLQGNGHRFLTSRPSP